MTSSVVLKSTTLAAGSTTKLDNANTQSGVTYLTGMTAPDMPIQLVTARSAAGAVITATAGSGILGISRTAGTSLALVGEATSGSTKTNAATFFTALPFGYNDGTALSVVANAEVTGTGTLTAASTTVEVAINSIVAGVETALSVTGGAQKNTATPTDFTWAVAGTNLTAGMQLAVTTTLVTVSSSGANTGKLNSLVIKA